MASERIGAEGPDGCLLSLVPLDVAVHIDLVASITDRKTPASHRPNSPLRSKTRIRKHPSTALLGKTHPLAGSAVREAGEDMVVVVVDCNGEHFDRVPDKGRSKLITRNSGSLRRKIHRRTTHKSLRMGKEFVIGSRWGWGFVIPFNMFAVVASSPTTSITTELGSVGVPIDVVPVVPGAHARECNGNRECMHKKSPGILIPGLRSVVRFRLV